MKYGNIESITYSLFNTTTNEELISEQQFPTSYSSNLISKSFNFEYSNEGNLSIYAKVIFTNTSQKKIEKTTTAYLLRSAGVPLAIRKGRIGINVDSSSFINDPNNDTKNSALYIAAYGDSAPVMEISASSGESNKDLLVYYKGTDEVGRVSSREGNAISIRGLT